MTSKQNAEPKDQQRQHALETLLRQPKPLRWMRAEWIYDPADHNFLNESNTFANLLDQQMPKLRTRQLTVAEWRKIRQLSIRGKCRRFSSKFTVHTRQALELYRRRYRIHADNPHYQRAANSDHSTMQNPIDLCLLFVEIKGLLASKASIIDEWKQINGAGTIGQSNAKGDKWPATVDLLARLMAVNDQISTGLDKLFCFPLAKKALLFDAVEKNTIAIQLSPEYFRQLCAVRFEQLQADVFTKMAMPQTFPTVTCLAFALLELVMVVADQRLMTSGCRDYFYNALNDQYAKLSTILLQEHIEYFQRSCLDFFNQML